MPSRSNTITAVLSAAILAATLPAVAKEELVVGFTQYPATLHPNIDSMAAKTYVLSMLRRPLTAYDKEWVLRCVLCTELPTIENGLAKTVDRPDGTKGVAVTYTIHAGATWSDGTPVTVDDVLFTAEVGKHPKSGVAAQEFYNRLERIETHDRKRFTLHVDKLTYQYNDVSDFQLLPAHLERPIFQADPDNYRNRTLFDAEPARAGLHFGPYRVSEVVAGSHLVLVQNPTWYGDKPHFKKITIRAIENTAALEANLLSGSIDYIAGELGLTLDQALAFQKRHGARFDISYKPGLVYEHIDLNLDNPALKDRRVRQGLLYALDRQSLSQQLFEGKQPVANSFVNPLDRVISDDVPSYRFDPARAQALFEEAGFKPGADGVRVNAAGQRLSFEIGTTAGNRTRESVQQVLQSQWKRVGVEIRIKNDPARVFFGEITRKRAFPAMAMYAWISSPENSPRNQLHAKHVPTEANSWAGQNYPGFADAEMDRLVEALEIELDFGKRKAIWARIQQIYATELPVLPLYFRADSFIVPKWLAGIEPTGHLHYTSLRVEHWKPR
ncbi:MAG: peptide ABC transporter substrate-binding protein [Alphaproteobacteria bacterium]|nr:peptide ABC transporter substrate-binding protein [Alphaproteobacteria bacterium]